MNPKFQLISSNKDFQSLEISLRKYLPHSTQMFNLVRLAQKQRFPKSSQIEFYLYEDPNPETDEPFVVCTQRPNPQSLYGVITLAPKSLITPRMLETFDNFIDWNHVKLFSNGHTSFTKHLKVLTDKHGNRTQHPEGLLGLAYFMDIEKALTLPDYMSATGDTIEVKPLCLEDAEHVFRNWHWALPHSKEQIRETIRSLDSRGVYVNSSLASSALLSPLGLINILHTEENHRRKGYGELTLRALSKAIASLGLVPGAEFEKGNDMSKGLLEKVGFKWGYDVEWMFFEK